MCYSVYQRDQIFVKGYGIFSYAKNMGKYIGKIINKNLSGKYSQKRLDHIKQCATNALKTNSKRMIQKTAEATGAFIDNKIADINTKVSKTSLQNSLEMSMIKKYLKKDIYISRRKTENY